MIIFKNKKYKTRELQVVPFGNVLISTTSLNNKLVNENGGYVSDEAAIIDEQIFYFVNSRQLDLSGERLIKLIRNEIK